MSTVGRVALVALLRASAGCLGGGGGQTTQQPPYGTQYVSRQAVALETATNAPPAKRPRFENLSDNHQRVFREALEKGQVKFGPDEDHPFDYNNSRVEYVRYEDQWYYVRVAIV